MARSPIVYGTLPGDGSGEIIFLSWQKTESNFVELYADVLAAQTDATQALADASAADTNADGREPALGNPTVNGHHLVGNTDGSRSWEGAGSGHTIEDDVNGVLATQSVLLFAGAGVEAADSGGKTVVTILGGAGMSELLDDAAPKLGGDLSLNGKVITGMVIGTDVAAEEHSHSDNGVFKVGASHKYPNTSQGMQDLVTDLYTNTMWNETANGTGTVALLENSKLVVGTGTSFRDYFWEMDVDGSGYISFDKGSTPTKWYPIEHIASDTELYLGTPFQESDDTSSVFRAGSPVMQTIELHENSSLNISLTNYVDVLNEPAIAITIRSMGGCSYKGRITPRARSGILRIENLSSYGDFGPSIRNDPDSDSIIDYYINDCNIESLARDFIILRSSGRIFTKNTYIRSAGDVYYPQTFGRGEVHNCVFYAADYLVRLTGGPAPLKGLMADQNVVFLMFNSTIRAPGSGVTSNGSTLMNLGVDPTIVDSQKGHELKFVNTSLEIKMIPSVADMSAFSVLPTNLRDSDVLLDSCTIGYVNGDAPSSPPTGWTNVADSYDLGNSGTTKMRLSIRNTRFPDLPSTWAYTDLVECVGDMGDKSTFLNPAVPVSDEICPLRASRFHFTVTANLTIPAPSIVGPKGHRFAFHFTQDNAGSFKITFNSVFKTNLGSVVSFSDLANAGRVIEFESNGTNYVQLNNAIVPGPQTVIVGEGGFPATSEGLASAFSAISALPQFTETALTGTVSVAKGVKAFLGSINNPMDYTWIKYADSATSGMSDDPTGKTYIGIAYNKRSMVKSPLYGDYLWTLLTDTIEFVPSFVWTWVKFADDAVGTNLSNSPEGRTHIGIKFVQGSITESTEYTQYDWQLISEPANWGTSVNGVGTSFESELSYKGVASRTSIGQAYISLASAGNRKWYPWDTVHNDTTLTLDVPWRETSGLSDVVAYKGVPIMHTIRITESLDDTLAYVTTNGGVLCCTIEAADGVLIDGVFDVFTSANPDGPITSGVLRFKNITAMAGQNFLLTGGGTGTRDNAFDLIMDNLYALDCNDWDVIHNVCPGRYYSKNAYVEGTWDIYMPNTCGSTEEIGGVYKSHKVDEQTALGGPNAMKSLSIGGNTRGNYKDCTFEVSVNGPNSGSQCMQMHTGVSSLYDYWPYENNVEFTNCQFNLYAQKHFEVSPAINMMVLANCRGCKLTLKNCSMDIVGPGAGDLVFPATWYMLTADDQSSEPAGPLNKIRIINCNFLDLPVDPNFYDIWQIEELVGDMGYRLVAGTGIIADAEIDILRASTFRISMSEATTIPSPAGTSGGALPQGARISFTLQDQKTGGGTACTWNADYIFHTAWAASPAQQLLSKVEFELIDNKWHQISIANTWM